MSVNENPIITGFVEDSQLAGAGEVVYTKGTSPYEFFLQDQNKYSHTGYFDGIEIGNHTVLCFSAALRVTCCGRWLVPVSTLLILRAVYLLYIPALRNLTGSDGLK